MARPRRSPYEGAREEALAEPLLPRWFVLLAVASVPIAVGTAVWAFVVFGPEEVPVAERRPPPAGALTTDVGDYNVGTSPAEPIQTDCGLVEGLRAAGSSLDRQRIAQAAERLCDIPLPEDAARRLRSFARMGGEVRFAQFAATGVDSTLDLGGDPPRLLVNARFAREGVDARWITPLLVHDTTYLERDPGTAEAALEARRLEHRVCQALFTEDRPSRGCQDAAALLELLDSLRALQAAGFA